MCRSEDLDMSCKNATLATAPWLQKVLKMKFEQHEETPMKGGLI